MLQIACNGAVAVLIMAIQYVGAYDMTTDTAEGWQDDPEYVSVSTAHRWIDDHDASWSEFLEDNPNAVVIGSGIMSDVIFNWLGY